MSNFYVPIDYSNVSEVVPKGDDILYSTLCKILRSRVGGGSIKWKSHVLITESGCAFSVPKRRKKTDLSFLKWTDLRNVRTTISEKLLLRWGVSAYSKIRLIAIRDPEYESEEDFLKCKSNFPNFCKELWSKQKQQEET